MINLDLKPQINLKFTEEPTNAHFCTKCNHWQVTPNLATNLRCSICGAITEGIDPDIVANICLIAVKLELDKYITALSQFSNNFILIWLIRRRVKYIINSFLILQNKHIKISFNISKPVGLKRLWKILRFKYYKWNYISIKIIIPNNQVYFNYTKYGKEWVINFKHEELL